MAIDGSPGRVYYGTITIHWVIAMVQFLTAVHTCSTAMALVQVRELEDS